jgi:uncharacterized protein YjbI with pentapeptide repeats
MVTATVHWNHPAQVASGSRAQLVSVRLVTLGASGTVLYSRTHARDGQAFTQHIVIELNARKAALLNSTDAVLTVTQEYQTAADPGGFFDAAEVAVTHLPTNEAEDELDERCSYATIKAGASLRECDLTGAVLTELDLSRADLGGANLQGAFLTYVNLSRAYLRGATLVHANVQGADLTGANLTHANLRRANLEYADLQQAVVRGANLTDANLENASLEFADLANANLTNANLRHARLDEAILTDVNFTGVDMSVAIREVRRSRSVRLVR